MPRDDFDRYMTSIDSNLAERAPKKTAADGFRDCYRYVCTVRQSRFLEHPNPDIQSWRLKQWCDKASDAAEREHAWLRFNAVENLISLDTAISQNE